MRITKIEKKKRLYLLELDSGDRLYVTEDTIVRFMLSKDKTVSDEELAEIETFAQFSYGKNLALYHLSFKQRTVQEVRDYLRKHEIAEETAEQVISSLKADQWLDDRQYSQTLIQQNTLSGDKGPYVLRQKLIRKGIAASLADEVLEETDFSETALRLAEKSLRRYAGKLPARGLKDKLTQVLTAKGFSYSQASAALDQISLEQEEVDEAALIFKELDKLYRKYERKYEGYDLRQRLIQALARKGFDYSDITAALREYL